MLLAARLAFVLIALSLAAVAPAVAQAALTVDNSDGSVYGEVSPCP